MVNPEEIVSKLNASNLSGNETDNWYSDLLKTSEGTQSMEEKENDDILKMRLRWSTWVLILIGIIIFFDITLVCFYGLGIWNFENPLVVIVVITDNFLKIFGLGFLITKEIFKKIYR